MSEPVSPRLKPYRVDLVDGERYSWCACGLSKAQPFCDGSHRDSFFKPLQFHASTTGPAVLCGCKQSNTAPHCDGSHNNLSEAYEEDERSVAELLSLTSESLFNEQGRAQLDGGCYVQRPEGLQWHLMGGLEVAPVITSVDGAIHLSQYAARLTSKQTEHLSCGMGAMVMYVDKGTVTLHLEGAELPLTERTGVYIKPGESFSLEGSGEEAAHCLFCICPGSFSLQTAEVSNSGGVDELSKRVAAYNPVLVEAMADRFYQVLVGEAVGSNDISQFIGQIPQSKAVPHRHLYEETILILSGQGMLWTENYRAAVAPGDFVFLPAQQEHSLQCHSEAGMELVGHFYPAGSPTINY